MIHEHGGMRTETDVCPVCGVRLAVQEFPTDVLLRKFRLPTNGLELDEECVAELARRIDQGKLQIDEQTRAAYVRDPEWIHTKPINSADAERPSEPKPNASEFFVESFPCETRRWSIWGPTADSPNTMTEGFGPARFVDGSIDPDCVVKFAEFYAVGFEEAARVFAVFRDGAVFDKVDA